jgi:hypothetical protein
MFKFYVTCSTPNGLLQQQLSVTWPNTSANLPGVPAGSVCTVSEDPNLPALPTGSSWSGVPVSTPANGVIEITKDGKNQITFTNTVHTCDDRGSVKITKRLEGVPPGFTGTFNFNVICWSGTTLITKQAQITIPGSSTVTVTGIPIGSSCTVTETGPLPSLPAGWLWLAPTYQPASGHVDLEGNCCSEIVVVDRAKFCCNQSQEEGYDNGYDTGYDTGTGTNEHDCVKTVVVSGIHYPGKTCAESLADFQAGELTNDYLTSKCPPKAPLTAVFDVSCQDTPTGPVYTATACCGRAPK